MTKPSPRDSRELARRNWKRERPYTYLYRRLDEFEQANPDCTFAKMGDMAFCALFAPHDPVCETLLKALLMQEHIVFPWEKKS
jgi:hypothetical protein